MPYHHRRLGFSREGGRTYDFTDTLKKSASDFYEGVKRWTFLFFSKAHLLIGQKKF
jgi:hypothetical protein